MLTKLVRLPDTLSPVKRTGLIVGILILGLLTLILPEERARHTGTPIVLATEPVDPHSLFQGDYVTLGYQISRLDKSLFAEPPDHARPGQTVYVVLKQDDDGPVWRPQRASFSAPDLQPGERVIQGTVRQPYFPLRVTYGIEAFFVPEKDGRWVERLPRTQVTVQVRVDNRGTATMDVLLVDGKPVFEPGGF